MKREPITYDLRQGAANSDHFYTHINAFSKSVLGYLEPKADWLIKDYKRFILQSNLERERSEGEYYIELLTMGMTWQRYRGASQSVAKPVLRLLALLYKMRKLHQRVKELLDQIRGPLASHFLASRIGCRPKNSSLQRKDFFRLLLWLEAAGEFKDEVKRLKIWANLFRTKDAGYFLRTITCAVEMITWFQAAAEKELGCYTGYLGHFLQHKHAAYKGREDVIFCGKEAVEYHLNMVASEVMNWGLRSEFAKTTHKTVLVPSCMSRPAGPACRSIKNGYEITCTLCSPECRVSHITQLGRKHDFAVNIVPHSSSFTNWLMRWKDSQDSGVVAVACLLNIAPGGYEMRELRISSQCVVLDECGCKKHWHETGIPTSLNERRLLEILGIKT